MAKNYQRLLINMQIKHQNNGSPPNIITKKKRFPPKSGLYHVFFKTTQNRVLLSLHLRHTTTSRPVRNRMAPRRVQ